MKTLGLMLGSLESLCMEEMDLLSLMEMHWFCWDTSTPFTSAYLGCKISFYSCSFTYLFFRFF
jgi:hypothetical protein